MVTPLATRRRRKLTWPEAKAFAREVCLRMARDNPDRYLVNMAKKLRDGRIFLDYLRNDRMATAVAPLSPGASPARPFRCRSPWAQVKADLDPRRYTVRTVPALLRRPRPGPTIATANGRSTTRSSGSGRRGSPREKARNGGEWSGQRSASPRHSADGGKVRRRICRRTTAPGNTSRNGTDSAVSRSRKATLSSLRAKSGKPLGRYFPEIVALLRELKRRDFVVDGELSSSSDGVSSFDALQMRLHPAESRIRKLSVETPAQLILFDMLADAGRHQPVDRPLAGARDSA